MLDPQLPAYGGEVGRAIAVAIVGEHTLDGDAPAGVALHRRFEGGDRACRSLIRRAGHLRPAAMVVDRNVAVLVPRLALALVGSGTPEIAPARTIRWDLAQTLDVEVHQITGCRPLIALDPLAWAQPVQTRKTSAAQHRVHRRARQAEEIAEQVRSPLPVYALDADGHGDVDAR